MIILLHGDHIEASRAELNRLRGTATDKEIRVIDGRGIDSNKLIQSLESQSLFGGDTMVVIEQLFGKLGRQIKRISEYCAVLANADKNSDIVLWEDKQMSPSVIKQLGPNLQARLFSLPVLLFQFLDSVRPGNREVVVSAFGKLMETDSAELVFSMLVKRVRQLIAITSGSVPAGLASWQVERLTTQGKSFTMNELILLYEKLAAAEYGLKSGVSPFPFRHAVEQVLITI